MEIPERLIAMKDPKNREKASTILADIVENMWEDKFSDILWALDLKLTNDNLCYFDRIKKRQFIIDMIKDDRTPSDSFFKGLHDVITWDNINMKKITRCEQCKLDMQWMNNQCSVHFAAAPIFEELAEGVTMRITALSEAIRLHKFQWVSFLLMKGAIVNEMIAYATFEGPIISLAIHMVASRNLPGVDLQDIIRILLSYGADRQTAMEHLTKRKSKAIYNDPSLRDLHAFNTQFPYYADMEKLLRNACTSVSDTLKLKMTSEEIIDTHFNVNCIKETVCSLPDKNYLIIQFDRYYKEEMRKNQNMKSEGEKERTMIFAVIAGIGEDDVVYSHSMNPDFYRKHQVERLNSHHTGRPPFTLTPNVKLNDGEREPEINRLKIDPIYNGVNLFIIPPALNERLYTLTINIDETRVDFSRIIFGGLALLSMKNGEGSKEQIEKVIEDQIRCGSVNKFNRLIDNSSGNDISI